MQYHKCAWRLLVTSILCKNIRQTITNNVDPMSIIEYYRNVELLPQLNKILLSLH
jgi:hypothetical protein